MRQPVCALKLIKTVIDDNKNIFGINKESIVSCFPFQDNYYYSFFLMFYFEIFSHKVTFTDYFVRPPVVSCFSSLVESQSLLGTLVSIASDSNREENITKKAHLRS